MPGVRAKEDTHVEDCRGWTRALCAVRHVQMVRQNAPHPLGRTAGVEQVEKAGADKNVEEEQKDEFRRGDQASEKR